MTKTAEGFGAHDSLTGYRAPAAFPGPEKPRPAAASGGALGVQGHSLGAHHSPTGCGARAAFPRQEKPRPAAVSGGTSGVHGLSPGTPFLPQAKKHSVLCFFLRLRLLVGRGA